MVSFLQINLGGGSAAQSLMLQTAAENNIDVVIASEFYKHGRVHEQWHRDTSDRAAVAVLTANIPVDDLGAGNNGFVWVAIGDMRIYSCYWSPNISPADFEDFLRRLEASIRSSPGDVVVAGDFDAKHSEWDSPTDDGKGEALADLAQALDQVIYNRGQILTREKNEQQSYIDVTLVSARLQHKVVGWEVLKEETLSDHNYVKFSVMAETAPPQTTSGWSTRHMNKAQFVASLNGQPITENVSAEDSARDLIAAISRAMDSACYGWIVNKNTTVY